jgi:hypothetical protein
VGPAARDDALTSDQSRPSADHWVEKGEQLQPAYVASDSRVTPFVSLFRPPRFDFALSGVDVRERLPVGVVNPVRRPAAMPKNVSEWIFDSSEETSMRHGFLTLSQSRDGPHR